MNTTATHDAYPLRTVSARTGLTPDLIRAWERRYGVVQPIRGARGARLYTASDVEHLRLLARVVSTGRAIGDVAALSTTELAEMSLQTAAPGSKAAGARAELVQRVIDHLVEFDEESVSRILGDAVLAVGARTFAVEIAAPLVRQVGELWQAGKLSMASEHLLTATLRTLIGGLARSRSATGRPIVLATPEGERHEVGLMMVALLAVDAGVRAINLGVDLPAREIAAAAAKTKARAVGVSVVSSENAAHAAICLGELAGALPRSIELWIGGAAAPTASAGLGGSFLLLDGLERAESELARLAASTPRGA